MTNDAGFTKQDLIVMDKILGGSVPVCKELSGEAARAFFQEILNDSKKEDDPNDE